MKHETQQIVKHHSLTEEQITLTKLIDGWKVKSHDKNYNTDEKFIKMFQL